MIERSRRMPEQELKRIFDAAPFVKVVGIELVSFGSGYCETELRILPEHMQQTAFVHAGVLATMADHTAGGAATTLVGPDEFILTAEFKINFLRGAQGERLRCKGTVLKPGSNLTVVECEVFCEQGEKSRLVSKATATMAVLKKVRKPSSL